MTAEHVSQANVSQDEYFDGFAKPRVWHSFVCCISQQIESMQLQLDFGLSLVPPCEVLSDPSPGQIHKRLHLAFATAATRLVPSDHALSIKGTLRSLPRTALVYEGGESGSNRPNHCPENREHTW